MTHFPLLAACYFSSCRVQLSRFEDKMAGRRRASVARALTDSLRGLQQEALAVNWLAVFKASFMLLFVAYPGERTSGLV